MYKILIHTGVRTVYDNLHNHTDLLYTAKRVSDGSHPCDIF